MADDDEIDILGDFSFNSCLAQNNQGIPSCSSREDTVHPQWFLDSTATNWYDNDREKRVKLGPSRKLSGNSAMNNHYRVRHSSWNQAERDLLTKEMAKYGRNVNKISQTIKSKSAAEIQALIEAEYGVNLDTPSFGLVRSDEQDDVPSVVQEEIVTDDSSISNVLSLVATASPTITVPKHPFRKKKNNVKARNLKTDAVLIKPDLIVNPTEIFYDDDLIIGSTESVGSELDCSNKLVKSMAKQQKEKVKAMKKMGNHRRKVTKNFDKGRPRTSSKELLKSPQERRKDSSVSEESTKSPKLQIVLGSGQALPISEGEQVIKIEKKKDSESDSDIEVDIDSDCEGSNSKNVKTEVESLSSDVQEAPIAVPLAKFEPMPKRQKKINLGGGGGYTIMHTAAGDLYQVGAEPRRERAPRKQPVQLIHCRMYNDEHPAPYSVQLAVSALIVMEAHAHGSRAEVMGLLGGALRPAAGPGAALLELAAYCPAAAAGGSTHCDMDPVSQAMAGASLRARGLRVVGWHHSHPRFAAAPSAVDLRSQLALQRALEPCAALITSQHWPAGRAASQYRCFRVEGEAGFALRVRLRADVSRAAAPALLAELRALWRDAPPDRHSIRLDKDVCPTAKITYLEKKKKSVCEMIIMPNDDYAKKVMPDEAHHSRSFQCVSSVSHHLRAAGYSADDPVVTQLLQGMRDIFR